MTITKGYRCPVEWKPLELSFGICGGCALPITKRQLGWYSPELHMIRCSSCGVPSVTTPSPTRVQLSQDPVAGSAALREANARKDSNWRRGAIGEYLMSQILQEELRSEAILLNDRAIPNTNINVDHIVIAPSGVWAIDVKKWGGVIDYRTPNLKRVKEHLFVNKVDQTRKVEEVYDFVIPIAQVLADRTIPVHPAMAFIEGEFTFKTALKIRARGGLMHDGVLLHGPRGVIREINQDGPLDQPAISRIAVLLDSRLQAR
jgi:Nuclease-related domain